MSHALDLLLNLLQRLQVNFSYRINQFPCAALVAVYCFFMAAPPATAVMKVSEYQAKAAYLYNFISFFEWPVSDSGRFVIGIVGEDQFGTSFKDVEDRPVKSTGAPLIIKRLGPYRPSLDLRECNLLFLEASEEKHAQAVLQSIAGLPILTVSEFDGFLEKGGMLNLIMVQEKLRWELNRAALDRVGFKFHAMILQSAVRVIP